jgi:hypothetical protein
MDKYQLQTKSYDFPNPVQFGNDLLIDIPTNLGDLIHKLYIKVQFPNLSSNVIPYAGCFIVKMFELRHGASVIERVYDDNLLFHFQYTSGIGRQSGYQQLVGGPNNTPLPEYIIPLLLSNENAYPMNIPLSVRVLLNDSSVFMSPVYTGYVQMSLVVESVYLNYSITQPLRYLVKNFQRLEFIIQPNETSVQLVVYFVNDVKELYWVIYQNKGTYLDDLVSLELLFSGITHIDSEVGTNMYLKVIEPLEKHGIVPTVPIYSYSFAIDSNSKQPSGEFNLTQIPYQTHKIQVSSSPYRRTIVLYAESYNICTIDNGELTMSFVMNESGFKK